MSTWQIFSDAGNSFRWEIYDRDLQINPDDEHFDSPNGSSRLPSMSDLVLQGCSKLLENRDEGVGSSPMFRTGLGKSVAVKQSSIAKALSVLGDDTGQVLARDNGCGSSNSLFQTGSGKTVNISSDGLVRAKTLLGLEEDNDNCIFQGLQHSVKPYNPNGPFGWKSPSHSEMRDCVSNCDIKDGTSVSRPLLTSMSGSAGSRLKNQANPNVMQPEMQSSALKPPPIKFHTAGGRSISVSSDALKRARSLLGDPELGTFLNEEDADDSLFSFSEARFNDILSNEGNDPCTPFYCEEMANNKNSSKSFVTPLRSSSNQVQLSVKSEHIISGNNLIKEFDAVHYDSVCRLNTNASSLEKRLSDRQGDPNTAAKSSLANGVSSRISPLGRSPARPLVDISNTIGTVCKNNGQIANVKRILGKSSASPFKKPRSSKFSTPLNKNVPLVPNGLSTLPSEHSSCRKRISSRYPFQIPRMYVKEYFKAPPLHQNTLELLSDQVRCITSTNAEKYMFHDESGLNCIGPEAFFHILAQSGASMQYASKEWVINHYKWIVWKLACYERSYPTKAAGKFLTVSNVLEELKYRYEREVNHGHRSSIKRILEGDASPSSMIVLCISAICSNCDLKTETSSMAAIGDECSSTTKVELTDGWYAMDAVLDVPLSKHLAAGKLYVGQKLRIWGAGLCGWVGPVSPLEVSRTVSLLLHGNGTYRAHWADRLGFCKGVGSPLAFRCIKCNGGPVPRTLVGVRRIYPVLYKERLGNGGSIVRSERMESKMVQLYNQRRATVVEGIISEFQRDIKGSHDFDDNDSEEGAKILKILETAAEPEVLMAEMSPEQLTSFTTYQAKLEATRQANTDKAIEKALEAAGLGEREVTPFMRVRIVGLTKKICHGMDSPKEGLITIWNPTEKQQHELVEGQAYGIAGLVPFNSDADTLYLQARGSTTKWRPLSSQATEHFKYLL
ncbi:protein BREAST CANCER SUSCEPTIBILITY 2 homolog B isoform X2 [Corylus avellana]|uniref:protein BREAST CANCER SUSCEPTIBILITY 2 homolog B isoform X2 n=1 Tax=Corylus avellana TaxID=13451 RepID=UPI00286C54BF|nr:protein BREAST CANCER SUSCEPTIBILITY 2 homolog B isoform X2 [Corylus avellana]